MRLDIKNSDIVLARFMGDEWISKPFIYQLTCFATPSNLVATIKIGQPFSFSIIHDSHKEQVFNACIEKIVRHSTTSDGLSKYTVFARPWFWFLKNSCQSGCYINQSIPDIIKSVFSEDGYYDYDMSLLSRDYLRLNYVVRYQESGFDFVSRLMEQNGIYYSFQHEEARHVMMVEDSPSPSAYFYQPLNVIEQHWKNKSCYTSGDEGGLHAGVCLEVNDEAFYINHIRHCAFDMRHAVQHDDEHWTSGNHEHPYTNQLWLFPSSMRCVPVIKTPEPVVAGVLSGEVVGPVGSEVYTEALSQVKIHMDWDNKNNQSSGVDKASTHWIRSIQPYAGNGWGFQQVPRIGDEVLLAYADGIPERPIILSSVYNPKNSCPHIVQHHSGFKSHPIGDQDCNAGHQLRLDDSHNNSHIFIKSQRDQSVYVKGMSHKNIQNDSRITVEQGAISVEVEGLYTIVAQKKLILKLNSSEIILDESGVHLHSDNINFQ